MVDGEEKYPVRRLKKRVLGIDEVGVEGEFSCVAGAVTFVGMMWCMVKRNLVLQVGSLTGSVTYVVRDDVVVVDYISGAAIEEKGPWHRWC